MSSKMNPPSRPFLPYSHPSISSVEDLNGFNPKRISQQSVQSLATKPQPMAPYVQLDQSTNAKIERAQRHRASPISRKGMFTVRVAAVLLRVAQLAGAMGLLVCMLFVRKLDEITGWICRAPPAVAIFHTVYYIYHVSGSDRVRTPKSSVSYFLFASITDLAIISFYSFIAILSWKQYQADEMEWETIFDNSETSLKIFLTVFFIACGAGGLTLLSLLGTLYLIRVFRALASLSVDQNPFLEEKDVYIQLPGKRWSASTAASSAPSLPEVSKAVPFLSTRHTDMSSPRNSVQYSNIPVPPSHTPRHSQLYPATGHLYPASGPVPYDSIDRSTKEEKGAKEEKNTKDESDAASTKTASSRKGKKSWGNLGASALPKRKNSGGSNMIPEGGKPTSTGLQPTADGEREWSFSFRKRSETQAGAP